MQISNAKSILLSQEAEWSRMMTEETDRQSLIRYGITLMIIAYLLEAVLMFLFSMAISTIIPFTATHIVAMVIVQAALAIASIYFVPQILAALAPSFGGQNNSLNALKLYVFAATPMWIGAALMLIPVLGFLAAIAGAIFGVYLFWKHFAQALSIPDDKKITYLIVAIVVIGLVQILIGMIGGAVAEAIAPSAVFHFGA